ncbi:hypothetical protein JL722_9233 [Aureococcus anophagefferens]|nr:hypothetical protein JL722_9233 [Aureococcus anophagefferens]
MEVDATRIRRAEKKRAIERQRAEVAALRSRAAGRAKAPPPRAAAPRRTTLARDAARDAAAAFDRRVATPTRETNPVLAAVDAAPRSGATRRGGAEALGAFDAPAPRRRRCSRASRARTLRASARGSTRPCARGRRRGPADGRRRTSAGDAAAPRSTLDAASAAWEAVAASNVDPGDGASRLLASVEGEDFLRFGARLYETMRAATVDLSLSSAAGAPPRANPVVESVTSLPPPPARVSTASAAGRPVHDLSLVASSHHAAAPLLGRGA